MNWERTLPPLLALLVLGAVTTAVVIAVSAASTLPSGPIDVVWDKAACAHCRMHVGEPRFAAQLILRDGRALVFDDPGCLFAYVAAERPDVHATWFHAFDGDRWLDESEVAFRTVDSSPMGYGLAAVAAGTNGALDPVAAAVRCRSVPHREAGR